jgi:hypothetical protein
VILIAVLELWRSIPQIAYVMLSNDWTNNTLQFIVIWAMWVVMVQNPLSSS